MIPHVEPLATLASGVMRGCCCGHQQNVPDVALLRVQSLLSPLPGRFAPRGVSCTARAWGFRRGSHRKGRLEKLFRELVGASDYLEPKWLAS